ncbi:MAG: hypothetical protein V4690_02655 [Patescibacteria group bacterium]
MKDDMLGLLIILGIIAIALYGGINNSKENLAASDNTNSPKTTQKTIRETENQITELKKQLKAEEAKVTQSKYKDVVILALLSRSSNPSKEYVAIRVNSRATTTIPVTGWTIKTNYGDTVVIPKASYLFFSGMPNSEENVFLNSKDVLYIVTGHSPIGVGFRTNKCTGYLDQFQSFTPYLKDNCPLAEKEAPLYIPNNTGNTACLKYIDSLRQCQINTKNIPVSWTGECKNFIDQKIGYPACIQTYKNDPDFYENEWRVYLKRSSSIWTARNLTLTLYDNEGKIVDILER